MSKGKGAVAKVLARTPSERREWAFIVIQFLYTIICTVGVKINPCSEIS